ncbi:hypothetical protein BRARA_J00628 [Brassica rapa]|uniref:Uncharacterized protein n=1 Tax=Brassica campestris TaxID=3711 RepID=A0A397XQP3_BRACM|nr:hypothetical protein BRARA_J00628 [Brassica rapa]
MRFASSSTKRLLTFCTSQNSVFGNRSSSTHNVRSTSASGRYVAGLGLEPSPHSINDHVLQYLLFRTRETREFGFCSMRQACLARRDWLKLLISWKPRLPSSFLLHSLCQETHAIFLLLAPLLHQNSTMALVSLSHTLTYKFHSMAYAPSQFCEGPCTCLNTSTYSATTRMVSSLEASTSKYALFLFPT